MSRHVTRPTVHPDATALARRIKDARPERSDPDGECHVRIAAIAKRLGKDVSALLDTWAERAAIHRWDEGMSQHDAETLAVDDVRIIYEPATKGLGA